MVRLGFVFVGLLPFGVSALPSRTRACGRIGAPYAILDISKENTSEPAKPYDPYVVANQLVEKTGRKDGVATILRFATPPGQANCMFTVNFPAARFSEVQIGGPGWQTPQLSISKLAHLNQSNPSYDDLEIIPEPLGALTVQPGRYVFNSAQACGPAADFLVEIPSWISGNMGVSWKNDVHADTNDIDKSFGMFVNCDC
ncbi:hypothetical protein QBC46DRAFT_375826 [Diplogelasinospora grovesii]|uniref:Ubiquitin 3 binding protein But2 C-terminal domain-containing protein n=1 Tax=Diplogelasinospora grovesii TaxID=303347 RepID=A0AAN6NFN6_9PEZI|nr:hypothetical protein QBC46DRAFT_375826 [Diplogelasinospora grovesii]